MNKPLVREKFKKYPEKAKRGESVAIVQLQYSYNCNFNCRHCAISSLRKRNNKSVKIFTIEDIKILGDQMDELGLASVNISGGEPLIFKELDEIIKAFKPERFYMQCDTNGWLMTEELAKHLKELGVDRMQTSIDSLNEKEHDNFRRKPGSWRRAIKGVEFIQRAGLDIQVATVVTKQRLKTDEFINFLDFMKEKSVPVSVVWAKPVGEWEGHLEGLIDKNDKEYFRELERVYNVYDHTTLNNYGTYNGCCSVKRLINITQYGDILPCCYFYVSLGNFFFEPLKDIIERGMKIEYFSKIMDKCLMTEDLKFINKYVTKTWGKNNLPLPIEDIFEKGNFI